MANAAPQSSWARSAYADCPLIEIVHLHDCIRGELTTLRSSISQLRREILAAGPNAPIDSALEFQIHSHVKMLHAVFEAHSTAEDETIWPALRAKTTHGLAYESDTIRERDHLEDHANEDRLFREIGGVLSLIGRMPSNTPERLDSLRHLEALVTEVETTFKAHLEKEESSAMPLIQKVFTDAEMKALVGEIMGKRSAELMQAILEMMVRNLNAQDAATMLRHIRQGVEGSYFETWLEGGGFRWESIDVNTTATSSSAGGGGGGGLTAVAGTSAEAPGRGCGGGGGGRALSNGGQQRMSASLTRTNSMVLPTCDLEATFTQVLSRSGFSATDGVGGVGCHVCSAFGRCPEGGESVSQQELQAFARSMNSLSLTTTTTTTCTASQAAPSSPCSSPSPQASLPMPRVLVRGGGNGGSGSGNNSSSTTTSSSGSISSSSSSSESQGGSLCSESVAKGRLVQAVQSRLWELRRTNKRRRKQRIGSNSNSTTNASDANISAFPSAFALQSFPSFSATSMPLSSSSSSSSSYSYADTGFSDDTDPPKADHHHHEEAGTCEGRFPSSWVAPKLDLVRRSGHSARTSGGEDTGSSRSNQAAADGKTLEHPPPPLPPPPRFPASDLKPSYTLPTAAEPVPGGLPSSLSPHHAPPQTQFTRELGCAHYARGCKLRAPCCDRLFACRLCHDHAGAATSTSTTAAMTPLSTGPGGGGGEQEDDEEEEEDAVTSCTATLDMFAVKEMLCMTCGALQPVARACASDVCTATATTAIAMLELACNPPTLNPPPPSSSLPLSNSATSAASAAAAAAGTAASSSLSSSEEFDENGRRVLGKYYCHVCKLWDNSLSKHIYHCPYCNVCRVGKGLGIDYRHCMACNCCVELRADREADQARHKCVSQALGGSCAVCTESLRFSTKPLKGLPCGHTLHLGCYTQYRRYAYTCPVCLKSMDDMREYFGRLDREEANEIIGRGGGGGGGFGGGGGSSSGGFTLPQQLGGGVVGNLHMTNTRNRIACNDCGARELVPFRMLHHKCPCCGSYNTRVLETVVLRPGESS